MLEAPTAGRNGDTGSNPVRDKRSTYRTSKHTTMKAYDNYQKYQRRNVGSTVATRKASPQDITAARVDCGVDYHVANATEKE